MVKDLLPIINQSSKPDVDTSNVREAYTNNDYLNNFLSKMEDIRTKLDSFQQNTQAIKSVQNDILSASAESEEARKRLESLEGSVKENISNISRELKKLQADLKNSTEGTPAEIKIKQNNVSSMAQSFKETMVNYNNSQLDFKQKCKDRLIRQYDILGKAPTEQELDNILNTQDMQIFTSNIVKDTAEAKVTLAEIEARHQEIIKLENSINELAEMITEMSTLIHSQGDQVNDISYNVSQSKDYVAEGKVQITKAVEYKKKATKKKWILAFVVFLILLIIILAIAIPLATKTA